MKDHRTVEDILLTVEAFFKEGQDAYPTTQLPLPTQRPLSPTDTKDD